MLKAWRERKPELRIDFAHKALEEKPDYIPALLLLAEEESSMLVDVSDWCLVYGTAILDDFPDEKSSTVSRRYLHFFKNG